MKLHFAKVSKLLIVLLLLSLVGGGEAWASEGVITATVTVNPLSVSVLAPSTVSVGQTFDVEATVENRGGTRVERASATINLPEGLELVKHKAERTLGAIPPHKGKSITWQVRAIEVGEYVVSVSASGEYEEALITEDSSATITITPEALPLWDRFFGWMLRLFPWQLYDYCIRE